KIYTNALPTACANSMCSGHTPEERREGDSSGRIRLHGRCGAAEGVNLCASSVDCDDQRPAGHVHLEAARALDLRDEVDVGQRRCASAASSASMASKPSLIQ